MEIPFQKKSRKNRKNQVHFSHLCAGWSMIWCKLLKILGLMMNLVIYHGHQAMNFSKILHGCWFVSEKPKSRKKAEKLFCFLVFGLWRGGAKFQIQIFCPWRMSKFKLEPSKPNLGCLHLSLQFQKQKRWKNAPDFSVFSVFSVFCYMKLSFFELHIPSSVSSLPQLPHSFHSWRTAFHSSRTRVGLSTLSYVGRNSIDGEDWRESSFVFSNCYCYHQTIELMSANSYVVFRFIMIRCI